MFRYDTCILREKYTVMKIVVFTIHLEIGQRVNLKLVFTITADVDCWLRNKLLKSINLYNVVGLMS